MKRNWKKYGARWGKAVMELICARNEEQCKAFASKVVRRCEEIVR